MKYHCKAAQDDRGRTGLMESGHSPGKALCGAVTARPDTFVYDGPAFDSHYAKGHECKRCRVIRDRTGAES